MSNQDDIDEMEEKKELEKYEKVKDNKFVQQKLSAWRPVPTILCTTLTMSIFGALCIIVGAIIFTTNEQLQEQVIRYDDKCLITGVDCIVNLSIKQEMRGPIIVYYQLDNFYQNHRRYIKSKAGGQLSGANVDDVSLISSECEPVTCATQINKKTTVSGRPMISGMVANPCGLIAKSFFSDTYSITHLVSNKMIFINETDLAWPMEREQTYKRPTHNKYGKPINWQDYQWIDVTDEHFMVWMRPAGFVNFRKIWGRIFQTLETGEYTITIKNNYEVKSFGGKKYLVVSTVNNIGGKSMFLGIAYIILGGVSILTAVVFLILYFVKKARSK